MGNSLFKKQSLFNKSIDEYPSKSKFFEDILKTNLGSPIKNSDKEFGSDIVFKYNDLNNVFILIDEYEDIVLGVKAYTDGNEPNDFESWTEIHSTSNIEGLSELFKVAKNHVDSIAKKKLKKGGKISDSFFGGNEFFYRNLHY